MEIVTKELAAELIRSMADIIYSLSSSILGALWQGAAGFFPSMIIAISNHDWASIALHVTLLFGSIVLVYRFVRQVVRQHIR